VMLVMRQRWAFSGRANRDETLRTFGNLPFHEVAKRFLVEAAILERRDKRGKRSPELHGMIS
jgi:hypothetical protein